MQVIYKYFIVNNNRSVHVSYFVTIYKQLIVHNKFVHAIFHHDNVIMNTFSVI